jgi:hypothetical protein
LVYRSGVLAVRCAPAANVSTTAPTTATINVSPKVARQRARNTQRNLYTTGLMAASFVADKCYGQKANATARGC